MHKESPSITLTYGKPLQESGQGAEQVNRENCWGTGVWQMPRPTSKQEQQHQGYPCTISIPSVKRWEVSDLKRWPESPGPDVIAASAEAWRHNLSFLVNNVPVSDVPVKTSGSFCSQRVCGSANTLNCGFMTDGPEGQAPETNFLSACPPCSAGFNIRFRKDIKEPFL